MHLEKILGSFAPNTGRIFRRKNTLGSYVVSASIQGLFAADFSLIYLASSIIVRQRSPGIEGCCAKYLQGQVEFSRVFSNFHKKITTFHENVPQGLLFCIIT